MASSIFISPEFFASFANVFGHEPFRKQQHTIHRCYGVLLAAIGRNNGMEATDYKLDPTEWEFLKEGDKFRNGDVYEKDFVIGGPKTAVKAGTKVTYDMMCYMPRRKIAANSYAAEMLRVQQRGIAFAAKYGNNTALEARVGLRLFPNPKCCGKRMYSVKLYRVLPANPCCKEHDDIYREFITKVYICGCIHCDNILRREYYG